MVQKKGEKQIERYRRLAPVAGLNCRHAKSSKYGIDQSATERQKNPALNPPFDVAEVWGIGITRLGKRRRAAAPQDASRDQMRPASALAFGVRQPSGALPASADPRPICAASSYLVFSGI